ncbi:50S ribosomal protein L22/unknown domain fusion protein [Rubripirellula tenax]|uniref:ASCH domain-containing protein n=1 Tax=Rubripirellula tenax TaxID=2528015 RepID=A0A5C6FE83_9BACT|nr:ASCH domain-containing protein [Rubripirellula tenax]TWU58504.1 50S ribosomal protein L22/unknown domain fusion protein [Rubripirellula tenax]
MLFLSIHPEHVKAIVEGRKTVELRKRQPSVDPGFAVVIYATMPTCEAVAVATVEAIQVGKPKTIWRNCGKLTAVSAQAFNDYFDGADKAVGIHLSNIAVFKEPVSLRELRKRWDGFQPPQQYRYLDSKQQKFIATREKTVGGCLLS